MKQKRFFWLLYSLLCFTYQHTDAASLTAHLQDACRYVRQAQITTMTLRVWHDVQTWIEKHPQESGACFAAMISVAIFMVWYAAHKQEMRQERETAWLEGYEAAYNECEQVFHRDWDQRLIDLQDDAYCRGWIAACRFQEMSL